MPYRYNPLLGNLEFYSKTLKYIYEDVILSAQNIADAKITLTKMPVMPETTFFFPAEGIMQRYGVDYKIVGKDITWSGMGLDGFLEESEEIRIFYQSQE